MNESIWLVIHVAHGRRDAISAHKSEQNANDIAKELNSRCEDQQWVVEEISLED